MRVPLTQGSYVAQSIIASAQRNVNLYAEKNPPDSLAPFTFYGAPGLRSLTAALGLPGRCLFHANNNGLYYAAGANVYRVSPPPLWTLTKLGTLGTSTGIVSMADNGSFLVIVDGSQQGWQIDLATDVMTMINGTQNAPPPTATFAFYGADRVDIIDGFMVFNQPATRAFYSTYLNEIVFDATYTADKNGYSDNLVTIIVTRREIWLIGERTTEMWFDSGDATYPFQIIPGPFIQHGCAAKASVAQVDGAIFWLAQDQAGKTQIVRGEGYKVVPISTSAMDYAFSNYPTVADAEGFCFTIGAHTFYQLNFPTANKSWRWDERTPGIWAEIVWTDNNGAENRHRASVAAFAYDVNVCADWETGQLYAFDLLNPTDNGQPMVYRRGYPHMMQDGRQVVYPGFTLDVQAATSTAYTVDQPGPFPLLVGPGGVGGNVTIDAGGPGPSVNNAGFGLFEEALLAGPAPPPATAPLVYMRYSDDRGRTWSNPLPQSLGATGDYLAQPQWNRLGRARDRVFEIFGVNPGGLAIMGAFLDPPPIPLNN